MKLRKNHFNEEKVMNRKKRWTALNLLIVLVFGFNQIARADDAQLVSMVNQLQKEMSEMRKTIESQNDKITRLESRSPANISMPASGGNAENLPMSDKEFGVRLGHALGDSDQWLKDLKFSGDMRLRYEHVDYRKGNVNHSGNENRERFRLRYGFEKKFNPDMKVGFRLASGQLTDPSSTNQTLTGNFADKNNLIDKAYAIYTPSWAKKGIVDKLELGAGKFTNPFTRGSSDMVWDTDVNPEGAYEMIDTKLIDTEDFGLRSYLTAGQLILREAAHTNTTLTAANSEIYAFQAGLNPEIKLGDTPIKLLDAVSFYNYSDYAHNSTFAAANSGANLAGGNPNVDGDATTLDANAFRVLEIYNSLEFKPISTLPSVNPYFDWAVNTADNAAPPSAGNQNQAWALGMKLGSQPKVKGDWSMGYAYKYIEANSVVGAFNDSDFGHSGRRGNVLSAEYKLTDGLSLSATGFLLNNLNHDTLTRDQLEKRFFVDLVWSF